MTSEHTKNARSTHCNFIDQILHVTAAHEESIPSVYLSIAIFSWQAKLFHVALAMCLGNRGDTTSPSVEEFASLIPEFYPEFFFFLSLHLLHPELKTINAK